MKTALDKYKQDLEEKATEVAEVREDILSMQSDITIGGLMILVDKLDKTIGEFLEDAAKKKYYDEDLCGTMKTSMSELSTAFSKMKPPTVSVYPSISVDMKPMETIVKDISQQNNRLIALIDKMNNSDNGEMYRLIMLLIQKQNAMLENVPVSNDNDGVKWQQLIEALRESRQAPERLDIVRSTYGVLQSITPIYKKAK